MTDLSKLRQLAAAATSGPWSVWTSNSIHRITSDANSMHRDGGVLSAVTTRDGVPDLHGDNRDADLAYIAALSPSVLLQILDELDRLNRVITEEKRLSTARLQGQIDIGIERDKLKGQLAAMRAARDEACEISHGLVCIGLDLVNGRAPSISTSEMIRTRADLIAALRAVGEKP